MPIFTWDNSYSVKVATVDMQHKTLVGMINELNDAMVAGKGRQAIEKIINGLIKYTATHFKLEEDYFDRYSYPDTAAHKREHAAFVNKVTQFKGDYEGGRLGLSIEVMNFLSAWLKEHIKGCDQKYTTFLNSKGVV